MDSIKPPTQEEWAVIAIGASVVLILGGLIGFGFILFDPPPKPDAVVTLRNVSALAVGIGALIGFVYWLVRRLIDS